MHIGPFERFSIFTSSLAIGERCQTTVTPLTAQCTHLVSGPSLTPEILNLDGPHARQAVTEVLVRRQG